MPKSVRELFQEGQDWRDVGNPEKRRELRDLYDQNYREQVAQATALNPSGRPEGLPSNYTVKEGDNLDTIATATGTTPADILAANPDVQQVRTGMVLKAHGIPTAPMPASQSVSMGGWNSGNVPNPGGVGLPSAGPQGAAPGGLGNPPARSYRPGAQGAAYQAAQNPYARNPYANIPGYVPPNAQPVANIPGVPAQYQPVYPGAANQPGTPATWAHPAPAAGQPPAAVTPQGQGRGTIDPWRSKAQWLDTIKTQQTLGYVPTPAEMATLIGLGVLKPASRSTGGGGSPYYPQFGRKHGGGGGGGGGWSHGGGGYPQGSRNKAPAFSAGSGFHGLVNWRI